MTMEEAAVLADELLGASEGRQRLAAGLPSTRRGDALASRRMDGRPPR